MTESCESCRYGLSREYRSVTDNILTIRRCHRHAPSSATGPVRVDWPAVRDDDWCGEWVEA